MEWFWGTQTNRQALSQTCNHIWRAQACATRKSARVCVRWGVFCTNVLPPVALCLELSPYPLASRSSAPRRPELSPPSTRPCPQWTCHQRPVLLTAFFFGILFLGTERILASCLAIACFAYVRKIFLSIGVSSKSAGVSRRLASSGILVSELSSQVYWFGRHPRSWFLLDPSPSFLYPTLRLILDCCVHGVTTPCTATFCLIERKARPSPVVAAQPGLQSFSIELHRDLQPQRILETSRICVHCGL